ncbi:hypothetical protein EV122DRAFT_290899 [Schizophyllum commune]
MAATLETRMQNLTIGEPSNNAANVTAKKDGRRRPRPEFHKRLDPSHADIPFVPEAHDTARHRYWHFGWPVSDEAVNEIIDRYTPDYLDEDRDVTDKYPHFNDLIEGLSGLKPIRLVLVEPTEDVSWQSPLVSHGRRAVTFFMVVSDCGGHFFRKRPTKEQMARLVRIFGKQPCWMMDALEKSQWHKYGHRR